MSSLNLVRLLKIPFVVLSSYRYSTVYHQGPVVRVSYVCTCRIFCISVEFRRYSSFSFLGVSSLDCARRFLGISSGLLDPSLARGAGEIPKNDRGVGSFRIVGGTAKGPLVCFKRTSRSLFGGWERGKLETPSFLWMFFFLLGLVQHVLLILSSLGPEIPFFEFPASSSLKLAHKSHALTF